MFAAMSSGGFRSCVFIPPAVLAARRDAEHATSPAFAYEPLLVAVIIFQIDLKNYFSLDIIDEYSTFISNYQSII